MDFTFTTEQLAIKSELLRFARAELNADLLRRDRNAEFSRANWRKCAQMGVLGLPFPEAFGGADADITTTMMAMEGLGAGSRDAGLIFSMNAQMWSVQAPIAGYGNESQKRRYLPGLCAGELIGAHGMSEPDTGSDAFNMKSRAVRKGDHYVLNGTKTWVSNAPVADLFVVFANTNPHGGVMGVTAFLVERGFDGFDTGREIDKMGLRTSPMAELVLDDCVVPVENRLGAEGQGAAIFNSSMEWERGCILAANLGAMERQLQTCIDYAEQRCQYGRPIIRFQAIEDKLVDLKVRLESSRLLLYRVAWAKENGMDATTFAAIAKLYVSEAWVSSCLDAIQLHGAYGFSTEGEVERDLRNAVGGRLYSGTSEIQRNLIARSLGM